VDAGIPAFEITKNLAQSLERFQRTLQDAVAAADIDGLSAADAIEKDMSAQISRGKRNEALDDGELSDIDRELRSYGSLARATSLAMIERRPGIDLTPSLERMTKGYNQLKNRLESLSTRERTGMTDAIEVARVRQRTHARVFGVVSFACLILLVGISIVVGRAQERIASAHRAAEERYRQLFERNPQPMWVCEEDTFRFLEVNEAAVEHYGYSREEFSRMSLRDVHRSEGEPLLLEDVTRGEAERRATRVWKHETKDGRLLDVEVTSRMIDFGGRAARLALLTDVTERRDMEEKLRQSQKMEAVGRLAGGVAHDFNNLLTVILGYTGLLQRSLRDAGRDRDAEAIEQIRVAGNRAASLTQQLLAFSRQQVLQAKVLDLNAVVSNLAPMLQRVIGEDIAFETSLDPGLPSVFADAGQLEQVIMNLVVNARDAMPEGGKLEIETRGVEACADESSRHPGSKPGPYVALSVRDTGAGMTPEVQSKVFEPFFTTKEVGKGTGLGLSTVHGIVQQSGGFVRLESAPGRGTTLRIYLPSVESEAAPARPLPESAVHRSLVTSQTILLIEDEKQLQELLGTVLAEHGYTVLTASDGLEALEVAKTHDGPIDLLVSDVVMPGAGGPRVVSEIQRFRPEAKVIFMSGYADDSIVRQGLTESGAHFLQKPFTPSAILKKVQQVLGDKDEAGAKAVKAESDGL
jgi:two-component system, cell cycle sensor histidine kinase and response regulator CckA